MFSSVCPRGQSPAHATVSRLRRPHPGRRGPSGRACARARRHPSIHGSAISDAAHASRHVAGRRLVECRADAGAPVAAAADRRRARHPHAAHGEPGRYGVAGDRSSGRGKRPAAAPQRRRPARRAGRNRRPCRAADAPRRLMAARAQLPKATEQFQEMPSCLHGLKRGSIRFRRMSRSSRRKR